MRIRLLVRRVESKSYLREYNVVGVRWCRYSCNCTLVYIGKLNTLHKIMSLQWPNKWEPNIFNEQHQYTILSALVHPAVMSEGTSNEYVRIMHFLPTASATAWFISLIYYLHEPGVSSSLGHRVLAAVNMTNTMQLCRIIYYSLADLHVSSDIFAHHQEHLNCNTRSCNTV
jgi:hypothetical protein